jgi:D-sedoheptulose 7-phosphate isomerase|tara:strand:+ start:791 stop:1405 length:615 start_codon:yes stop_codon:yes gene_type:complete
MKKKIITKSSLEKAIEDSILAKNSLFLIEKKISLTVKEIYKKIKLGGKIFLCGNGGSAADAQHLAAEFLVRLRPKINRKPIPAISLATDVSTITACANDYSFNDIFSRNLEALGCSKDVLIAISTSGNSKNILNVLKCAKKKNITTIAFLGNKGGKALKISDIPLIINSNNTARIQEAQIFLGHFIFEQVENKILKLKKKSKVL